MSSSTFSTNEGRAICPPWFTDQLIVRALEAGPFRTSGAVSGSTGPFVWTVLDPRRHGLIVFGRSPGTLLGYARAASGLHATVFTNGPMVGKRVGRWKVTKTVAALHFIGSIALGAGLGGLFGRRNGAFRQYAVGGLGAGAAVSCLRLLRGWRPCGEVRSRASGLEFHDDFDAEATRHAWLGRTSEDTFAAYRVGHGRLPPDVVEAVGGLILLVKDHLIPSTETGAAVYDRDFAEHHSKRGIAAWGLVPVPDPEGTEAVASIPLSGVLMVVGSKRARAADAAWFLQRVGACHAVAMDPRASSMVGTLASFQVGPPLPHRQMIQTYGLACVRLDRSRPNGLQSSSAGQ